MGLLDTVATVAVVGAVGFVGYEVAKNAGLLPGTSGASSPSGGDPAAAAIGAAAGSAVGSAGAGAISGGVDAFILNGQSICQLIDTWRAQGAPTTTWLAGFPLLPTISTGGGDPHSWANFRQWLSSSAFVDPGPTPASCF